MTEIHRKDLQPCACCGRGVMHAGVPLAWRVSIERIGFDRREIQRQAGLESIFGGTTAAVALADVFSTGPIGRTVEGSATTVLVCEECAVSSTLPIGVLAEIGATRDAKREEAAR